MANNKKRKIVFRTFYNIMIVLELIIGLYIIYRYKSEKIGKSLAFFQLSVLLLVMSIIDLFTAIRTKVATAKGALISKHEMPNLFEAAMAIKIVMLIVIGFGTVYFYFKI